MGVEATPARPTGLTTVVDTIAAPKAAFERLREVPTWGWAVIIVLILMVIGYILQKPAADHASIAMTQHIASLNASMTDAQKQKMIENAQHPPAYTVLFGIFGLVLTLFIAVLLNSAFMLMGNAVGKGQADFKRIWAASMNIAVPTFGLVYVLLAIITIIRGANSFTSPMDIQGATPGLQMLAPTASAGVRGALGAVSIGTVWGLFLNATMLMTLARVGKGVAWSFALLVLVLNVCFGFGAAAFFSSFLKM